jgi:hypothetical protein
VVSVCTPVERTIPILIASWRLNPTEKGWM